MRNALLTEKGYKSDYKYDRANLTNDSFSAYMDFEIIESSMDTIKLKSYPPLMQESWSYYRSQGESEVQVKIKNGIIVEAKAIILKKYNLFLDLDEEEPISPIEVPLKCIRSFKKLKLTYPPKT